MNECEGSWFYGTWTWADCTYSYYGERTSAETYNNRIANIENMNDYVDAINGLIDIMDDLKSAIDDIDTDIVSLDATINNIKSTC